MSSKNLHSTPQFFSVSRDQFFLPQQSPWTLQGWIDICRCNTFSLMNLWLPSFTFCFVVELASFINFLFILGISSFIWYAGQDISKIVADKSSSLPRIHSEACACWLSCRVHVRLIKSSDGGETWKTHLILYWTLENKVLRCLKFSLEFVSLKATGMSLFRAAIWTSTTTPSNRHKTSPPAPPFWAAWLLANWNLPL